MLRLNDMFRIQQRCYAPKVAKVTNHQGRKYFIACPKVIANDVTIARGWQKVNCPAWLEFILTLFCSEMWESNAEWGIGDGETRFMKINHR
jgi:hypothetical protein